MHEQYYAKVSNIDSVMYDFGSNGTGGCGDNDIDETVAVEGSLGVPLPNVYLTPTDCPRLTHLLHNPRACHEIS